MQCIGNTKQTLLQRREELAGVSSEIALVNHIILHCEDRRPLHLEVTSKQGTQEENRHAFEEVTY